MTPTSLPDAIRLIEELQARVDELETENGAQRDQLGIIHRELTEMHREHDNARLFISAIDQCSESVVFTDKEARYLYVNRSFEKITGYTREELVGKTPRILKSGLHSREFYKEMWSSILAGKTFHCRMTNRRKDGSQYHEEANISPVRNDAGEITNFVSVATDITELLNRKWALEEANAELRRSNSELEQFAYVASHDLQEPLRAVSSCMQLLEKKYVGQLDDRAQEFIHHAVDACHRMRTLIDGLLALSRVQSVIGHLEPTDTSHILEKARANLTHSIESSRARIEHGELPVVCAHPQMLVNLFQNLISNALKFHGEKPPVVHVEARRDNGFWIFSVRDEGIGIDPAHFDRIFQLFQRLHTRDEYPGTGLGLAICQKIVHHHGGRIWVESTPGHGSTFFFTLPALQPGGDSCP